MSHTDKIQSAISLIEEHNNALDPADEKVDITKFQKELKKLGGTTDSALAQCTWEDLENCGIPRILARKIATVFRVESKPERDPKFVSEKDAQRMNPLYLLQAYNPNDPTSPVTKRLKDLSRGQKFIVFGAGGEVNAAESYAILKEIMKGFDGKDSVEIDGKFYRCYVVGDTIGELVDEDPLFQGQPLRPDGTSDRIGRSWAGVSQYVRQLLYVAANLTRELAVTTDKANDILDVAKDSDADVKFRQRYRKAALQLAELIEEGKAPTLKVKLGAVQRRNDPFYQHKQF